MVNVQQSVLIHFVARDQVTGPLGLMAGSLATFSIEAMRMASSFEGAFARVASLLPQTKSQLSGLKDETLNLSKALGVDAVKSFDALYEAISAGVPKENAMDFLSVASKAAIAGVTDTKIAVDGMTSAMNAFKIPYTDATQVADQFFQAVNIGKFTFDQLSQSIYVAGPIAANTGVKLNELLGAASSITKQGAPVSVAMTQIRSAITALNKPSANLTTVLEKMGFETGKAAVSSLGLQGTFEGIRATADEMNMPLSKVFGRVEAVNGILALTGANAKVAREDLVGVTNSADAMGQAFSKIDDTPGRQWARLVAEIKIGFIELANSSLPFAEGLVGSLRSIVNGLSSLPEPLKQSVVQMGLFSGSLGVLLAVGLRFYQSMKVMAQSMVIAGTSFRDFTAAIALGPGAITQVMSKMQLLVAGLGIAVIAIGAIDLALRVFTGKGIFDRIFGKDDSAARLKKELDVIEAQIQHINELFPIGGARNKQEKLDLVSGLNDQLNQAILKINEFRNIINTVGGNNPRLNFGLSKDQVKEFQDNIASGKTALKEFLGTILSAQLPANEFNKVMLSMQESIGKMSESTQKQDFQKLFQGSEAYTKLLGNMKQDMSSAITSQEKLEKALQDYDMAGVQPAIAANEDYIETLKRMGYEIDETKGTLKDLQEIFKSLTEAQTVFSPKTKMIELNLAAINLQIAQYKNGLRDATGNLKVMTDAEEKQLAAMEAAKKDYQSQLEVVKATQDEYKALGEFIDSVANAYSLNAGKANEMRESMASLSTHIVNSSKSVDETKEKLLLLGQAFDQTNPAAAIAAIHLLSGTLGEARDDFITAGKTFPKEFWGQLLAGISDTTARNQMAGYLSALLNIDLSPFGDATASSWWAGFNSGFASGGFAPGEKDTLNGALSPTAGLPKIGLEAGKKAAGYFGTGFANGLEKGGGGAAEVKKTALDGFVSTYDHLLRLAILQHDFSEVGGTLVESIVTAIEDKSEGAGNAVGSALDAVVKRLKENLPEKEAKAWGEALAAAVRLAVETGTPAAVQAVEDLLTQTKGVLDDFTKKTAAVNKLGESVITALKNKYEAQRKRDLKQLDDDKDKIEIRYKAEVDAIDLAKKAALDALDLKGRASDTYFDAEKRKLDDWATAQKQALDDQKTAELRALEDEKQTRLDAVDDAVDSKRREIELMSRAEDEITNSDKMGDLRQQYNRARTNSERAKIQKEIDDQIRQNSARIRKDELTDEIDQLKTQSDNIKEEYDRRKQALDDYYQQEQRKLEASILAKQRNLDDSEKLARQGLEDEKAALEIRFQLQRDAMDREHADLLLQLDYKRDATNKYYDDIVTDQNLFNMTLKMLQEGNMQDILALLRDYYPDWQNAGQSLGDALITGLQSKKKTMLDEIAEIVEAARGALAIVGTLPGGGSVGAGGSSSGGRSYTIQPGDTLSAIAARLGMSWQDLYDKNRGAIGSNPSLIYPGTVLHYGSGTNFHGGGPAWVGEYGVELANLPKGSSVTSHNEVKNMIKQAVIEAGQGSMSGSIIIPIYLGGSKIDEIVVDAMKRKSRRSY